MDIDEGIDFGPASQEDGDRRQEPMNLHPDLPSSNPSLQQNSLNHATQGIYGQEDEKLSFFSSRTARISQNNHSAEIERPNGDGTDEVGAEDTKIKLEENGTDEVVVKDAKIKLEEEDIDERDDDAVESILEEDGSDERNKAVGAASPDVG